MAIRRQGILSQGAQVGGMMQRDLALKQAWTNSDLLHANDGNIPIDGGAYSDVIECIDRDVIRAQVTGLRDATIIPEVTLDADAPTNWAPLAKLPNDGIIVLDGYYTFIRFYYANSPSDQAALTMGAPTLTARNDGGSLLADTYNYRITALTANGESVPGANAASAAVTTGTTGSVLLSWTAVAGAIGYKIYGRTATHELFMAQVGAVTSWTDDGSITPAGALPVADSSAGPGKNPVLNLVVSRSSGG